MKIKSSVEVVINLGEYQHAKLQIDAGDRKLDSESPLQAGERLNYLVRSTLRKQMDAILAAQPQWKRDEAYALIGVAPANQDINEDEPQWRTDANGQGYWYPNEGEPEDRQTEVSGNTRDYLNTVVSGMGNAGFVDAGETYRTVMFHASVLARVLHFQPVSYHWDVKDNELVGGSLDGDSITARFEPGVHGVTLRMEDGDGEIVVLKLPIIVNQTPVGSTDQLSPETQYDAHYSVQVVPGENYAAVQLSCGETMNGVTGTYFSSYLWDVGDAQIISDITADTILARFPIGGHDVTMTATDERGGQRSYRFRVVVTDPDAIPF